MLGKCIKGKIIIFLQVTEVNVFNMKKPTFMCIAIARLTHRIILSICDYVFTSAMEFSIEMVSELA